MGLCFLLSACLDAIGSDLLRLDVDLLHVDVVVAFDIDLLCLDIDLRLFLNVDPALDGEHVGAVPCLNVDPFDVDLE